MSTSDAVVRVDERRCPSETLDGETIVIDTMTGSVFVFDGVASAVWRTALTPVRRSLLEQEAEHRYGEGAAADVGAFVDQLLEHELLALVASDAVAEAGRVDVDWPAEFGTPVLETIDDVADIITMDPIHDVDRDAGWPRAGG